MQENTPSIYLLAILYHKIVPSSGTGNFLSCPATGKERKLPPVVFLIIRLFI